MSDSDDDPLVTKPFKFVTGEYIAVKLLTLPGLITKPNLAGKFVWISEFPRNRSNPGRRPLALVL